MTPDNKKEPLGEKYPMRINKYLALKHNLTRRSADEFVQRGLVRLNGKKAVLGDKVNPNDEVTINEKSVAKTKMGYMYYAYNKPKGVVTHSPTENEVDIQAALLRDSRLPPNVIKELFPIGRLDKKSEGLIILTNDGRLSNTLLDPDMTHEKEYMVSINRDIPSFFKASMEKGVDLGDYITKPCRVKILGEKNFVITLTEGKRHQIRRMCEAMKTEVKSLKRTRIMNINLASIKPNEAKKIDGKSLVDFLQSLKLS